MESVTEDPNELSDGISEVDRDVIMVKSTWKYQVSYTDDYGVLCEHFICRKKDTLQTVSRAVAKGYDVNIKLINVKVKA